MSLRALVTLWLNKIMSSRIALALLFVAMLLGIKTVVAAITNEPQPLGDPFDDDDNSLFGGFKYWISDCVQLNADYMGYNDNEEYILTGGLNYDWVNHIGFAGWVERDSYTEDNVLVLEFRARADMTDLTAEVSDPE